MRANSNFPEEAEWRRRDYDVGSVRRNKKDKFWHTLRLIECNGLSPHIAREFATVNRGFTGLLAVYA